MSHTTIIIHTRNTQQGSDSATELDAHITYVPSDDLTPAQIAHKVAELISISQRMANHDRS